MKRCSLRSFVVTASIIVYAACSTARAAIESDGTRACLPAARHDLSLRRHTGIPSVAVSPKNGRLWVTFYGGEAPGEDSTAYVPLLTSAAGGKTWKTVLVAEPETGRRVFDPELWVAPDGRLRWTLTSRACHPNVNDLPVPFGGDEGDSASDRLMMAELDAESEPETLPAFRQVADGVMMCKPTVLKDGTWLLPVAQWRKEPSACFYASTDGGKTYSLRGGVSHFPKENRLYDEHTVVEQRNGDLLTFIRGTGLGKGPSCLESVSHDGGKTWAVGKKARFEQTSSRHFFRRLKSGKLLLVKNGPFDKDVGRKAMTAFLSEDDGVTWKGGLVLDERANVSYPDGDQAADGTIVVIYDRERILAQEILMASFTEEDVLAGRLVCPTSFLKRTVERLTDAAASSVNIDCGRQLFVDNRLIGTASGLKRGPDGELTADGSGTLVTKPLVFTGAHLFVDANCRSGSVTAELVDADGNVIPGFSAKDCAAIRGRDARKAELIFKGGSLARFGAKNVRIRFRLNCATLYSFWISPSAVRDVKVPDPSVFIDDGKYYLIGTENGLADVAKKEGAAVFPLYESDDLVAWRPAKTAAGAARLLRRADAFGKAKFWAPQLIRHEGRYYFAYTSDERWGIAVADAIGGPYRPHAAFPKGAGRIDPFVLVEEDGRVFAYFSDFNVGGGVGIAVVELTKDLKAFIGEPTLCVKNDRPWERKPLEPQYAELNKKLGYSGWTAYQCNTVTVEGPTVLKRNGKYVLFYSANDFRSPDYCVCVAVADAPQGPWRKLQEGSILSRAETGHNGTGHGDVFFDKAGAMWYVFHTHASTTSIGPRRTGKIRLVESVGADGYPRYRVDPATTRMFVLEPSKFATDFPITAYGARTDARPRENAAAIQKAIDAAAVKGGRVVVPAGEWTSGTIWLKSGVELHLEEGAVLKASADLADYNAEDAYPENWGCPKEEYWRGFHFIICRAAKNVAITGSGTIHGNGDAFFDERPLKYLPWMGPTAKCWWNGIRWAKDKTNLRPGQLVVFIKCRDVRVEGVTIRNAPCWSLFFHGCEDVYVKDYTVRNGPDDGNTDGVDVDCCRNVTLENLDIDTGDDAIAVRASAAMLGLDTRGVCENVKVRQARLGSTSSAFRIGVGEGIIRNVTVEDVTIFRAGTAFNLTGWYGNWETGGVDMEDIVFRNCRCANIREGFVVITGGAKQTFGIRNVTAENVTLPPEAKSDVRAWKGAAFAPENIQLDAAPRAGRPKERWCGFNLLGMFCKTKMAEGDTRIFGCFPEDRFRWMHDWGFNFARLPLDYRFFVEPGDWMKPVESQLEKLDEAVRLGRKYGIHVQINFHRAPGYCCNEPKEPQSLFLHREPLVAFTNLWSVLAKRYRGISNEALSFDLVNEPAPLEYYGATPSNYAVVARAALAAIRAVDPDRFAMSDGWRWGNEPVMALHPFDPASGESIHCYEPHIMTHHTIDDPKVKGPCPAWPPKGWTNGVEWLERNYVKAWRPAIDDGTFLHMGEVGCFQSVPHETYLAWLEDVLTVCDRHGWGWAIWNLDGKFGIMDTVRPGGQYEDFEGHRLERAALEVLQRHLRR